MALPVLLTVAGLGVGFVMLSKERANMAPPASGAAPVGGDPVAFDPADMLAAAEAPGPWQMPDGTQTEPSPTAPGAFVAGDNPGGADPATQPAEGTPTGVTVAGGGVPWNPTMSSTLQTAWMNPSQIMYGNTNGLTRQQQSAALAEIGPLTNMVF